MLQEILNKHRNKVTAHFADQEFYPDDVRQAMVEYAELYAKKVLEIAAEEATVWAPFHSYMHNAKMVNKDSILNIKLPEHE